MPPTDSHVAREFAALKGAAGEPLLLFEKVRKETVFVLLFRLYEKVTKKYTRGRRSAAAESVFVENRSCSAGLPPQTVDEKG